jgi:Putative Actinobacterial Holin-X, holin superfamily III
VSEADAPDIEILPERPGLKALAERLGKDAAAFAKAEGTYLKAQLGERADYAKPALFALVTGVALVFGVSTAMPVGVMLVLAPLIGAGWALLATLVLFVVLAALLMRFGAKRIKAALKKPEER